MSQDIVSDTLNQLMNAKRARKQEIVVTRYSKLLLKVLDMMKESDYIDYELKEGVLKIIIKQLNECKAIKPRFTVNMDNLDKYIRRFLPARNFGFVIVSTSKGLMTHTDAQENKIGGSLIAYTY